MNRQLYHKNITIIAQSLIVSVLAWITALPIFAQMITFETPKNISAETDVIKDGTPVEALQFDSPADSNSSGSAGATVNGIPFKIFAQDGGYQSYTFGNVTLNPTMDQVHGTIGYSSSVAVSPTFSAPYQALLNGSFWNFGFQTFNPSPNTYNDELIIGNLKAGQKYKFQVWSSNSQAISGQATTVSDGTTTVNLQQNTGAGLGQYVTGTFIATGSSMKIIFSTPPQTSDKPYNLNINAFLLESLQ